jgi:glycosyltransferase involved in cell wall biosynthesis
MRILVVTDAWRPQVNGVVHSLQALERSIGAAGGAVEFLTPEGYPSIPLPTYREIRLALASPWAIERRIDAIDPDHVHIATEGPLGLAARRLCLMRGAPFTTSYHTRFPEYLHARTRFPLALSYAAIRRFHNAGAGMMVSTERLAAELRAKGFARPMIWSRGVDADLFRSRARTLDLPRPIFLYVGRLAPEKNVDAFLSLDLPGTKLVVGEGPDRERLEHRYRQARFLGLKRGADLAAIYASADVFVFPSRTDTFGIGMLEAMASGVPVAAFPVLGPLDVVGDGGALSNDLRAACLAALQVPPSRARARALAFSWTASARQLLENVRAARAAWADSHARETRLVARAVAKTFENTTR